MPSNTKTRSARKCRAAEPEFCARHGNPALRNAKNVSDWLEKKEAQEQVTPAAPKSIEEEIRINKAKLEAERQAVLAGEAKERIPGWEEFGFQEPGGTRVVTKHWAYVATENKVNLDSLPAEQQQALKFFTSNNYRWLNAHLYGKRDLPEGTPSDRSFMTYNTDMNSQEVEENPTKRQAEEVMAHLDAVLDRKGEDRIVYRGMKDVMFRSPNPDETRTLEQQMHDEIDATYQIGAEVQRPGYLSASASPLTALGYAARSNGKYTNHPGVLFELKTSRGVSLTGGSSYDREQEVLLPRNVRWRVAAVHKDKTIYAEDRSGTYKSGRRLRKITLIQLVEIDEEP